MSLRKGGVLVFVNDEKTLAYMKKSEDAENNAPAKIDVILKNKASGQTIAREFKVAEAKTETEKMDNQK